MYGLTVVTAATEEPVSRDEAKRQCSVAKENSAFDLLLDDYRKAARDYVERYTNRQLCTATYDLQLDMFPVGVTPIYIPRSPLQSVTSATYLDADGNSTVWASSNYRVITSTDPGKITLGYQKVYPATYSVSGAVTVRFVAGYGAASAVPLGLKHAILLLVSHWFEQRSAVSEAFTRPVEMALQSLLDSYRVPDEWLCYEREGIATAAAGRY